MKRISPDLPLFFLDVVESTNTFMKELGQDGTLEEGTVLYAGEQTAGRGRPGNKWIHLPGNLAMSLWVSNTVDDDASWTLKAVFILLEIFSGLGIDCSLKYPNDVWLMNPPGKIAGILVEKVKNGYVIGLGVNRFAPPSIRKAAAFEGLPDIHQLAWKYTSLFHQAYLSSSSDRISLDLILERLGDHLLWKGRWVVWKGPDGPSIAKIIRLDQTGRLLVMASDGHSFLLPGTVQGLELVGESDGS
ncbi:MAG: biotin--[acetyl-CoA-carboxylase] ligase [Leptospirales bacterium]